MTTLRDAAQQALEVIGWLRLHLQRDHQCLHMDSTGSGIPAWIAKSQTAIRAALAEPQPEIEQLKAERDAAVEKLTAVSDALDYLHGGTPAMAVQLSSLRAERDALLAAAEKGTEYVLAQINQDLRAERDALLADAERYRYLRNRKKGEVFSKYGPDAGCWIDCEDEQQHLVLLTGDDADAAIDAARSKT